MNAVAPLSPETDRRRFIGGLQSDRVPALNEGVVRRLYGAGMTIAEVARELGVSYRGLWLFMERCGIARRVAAKRDQRANKNTNWKGDRVGYKAAHDRVSSARGKPAQCEQCGESSKTALYEWANLTGAYHDPADYRRLCVPCHRTFDASRRRKS